MLRPPSREIDDGIVDFQHFLFERQRGELNRLNLEYRNLIAVSRGNLASQNRVHKAALTILAAPSFGQLLQIVTTDLAILLDVDVVTIAVENVAGITPRLNVQGVHLLPAGTVEEWLGEDKTVVYDADVAGDPALFGADSAAGLVRSQALLRLRFGREIADRAALPWHAQIRAVPPRPRHRASGLPRPDRRTVDRPVAQPGAMIPGPRRPPAAFPHPPRAFAAGALPGRGGVAYRDRRLARVAGRRAPRLGAHRRRLRARSRGVL